MYLCGWNPDTDTYDYEKEKINSQDICFESYCKYCDKTTTFSFWNGWPWKQYCTECGHLKFCG